MSANVPNYGVRKVVDSQTVASTGSYTSAVFKVENVTAFTIWAKSVSATGTADIKIDFYQTPVTGTYASGDPVVATAIDATSTPTETPLEYTNTTINAVVAAQAWVVVTGVASNPADTVVDLYVSMRY